jgi:5-methylcytosine-specific restriction protein B
VDPTLKILYGPPGTGKTWKAARDAVLLLDPSVTDENITSRHREYVDPGRIVWVTFHPSYTYKDFVEGLRPVVKDVGVTYEPQPGPFRAACANALAPPLTQKFTVGQIISSSTRSRYQVVHHEPGVVILENIKGGKGDGLRVPVSLWLVEQLVNKGYKPGDVSQPGAATARKLEISEDTNTDGERLRCMNVNSTHVAINVNGWCPAVHPPRRRHRCWPPG